MSNILADLLFGNYILFSNFSLHILKGHFDELSKKNASDRSTMLQEKYFPI